MRPSGHAKKVIATVRQGALDSFVVEVDATGASGTGRVVLELVGIRADGRQTEAAQSEEERDALHARQARGHARGEDRRPSSYSFMANSRRASASNRSGLVLSDRSKSSE